MSAEITNRELSREGIPVRTVVLPNGKKVIVKELTVGQVLVWLDEIDKKANSAKPEKDQDSHFHVVDAYLYNQFTLTDLTHMTQIGREDIKTYPPSYLKIILEVCRELNPYFFDMRSRLTKMGGSAVLESESD